MRSLSRSHSERAGDAHEMQASLIATKRELNTARIELSRGRVEIARLETLVKKQQQQLDALLGDGDGPTRHELEKNLAVRRLTEKATSDREALKQVISAREAEVRARDATIAELRQSQAATTLEEIIGRSDLLAQVSRGDPSLDDLDLNPLLVRADSGDQKVVSTVVGRNEVPETLDAQMIEDAVRW